MYINDISIKIYFICNNSTEIQCSSIFVFSFSFFYSSPNFISKKKFFFKKNGLKQKKKKNLNEDNVSRGKRRK